MGEVFDVGSGTPCELWKIKNRLIKHYYILTLSRKDEEPSENEIAELFSVGFREAERLSLKEIGKSGAFSIIYSGYSARRIRGWHMHIFLISNRWQKFLLYFLLVGKNLLKALKIRKDNYKN